MVTQKPIGLKIDADLLQRLDEEVRTTLMSRNKFINEAVKKYLEIREVRRYQRLAESQGHAMARETLEFCKKNLAENIHYYLDTLEVY